MNDKLDLSLGLQIEWDNWQKERMKRLEEISGSKEASSRFWKLIEEDRAMHRFFNNLVKKAGKEK